MAKCCDLTERVGAGAGPGELGTATGIAAWICQAVRARVPRRDHPDVTWQAWLRVVRYGATYTLSGEAGPRHYVQLLAAHECNDYWNRRGFWEERRAPGEAPVPRDPEKRRRARDEAAQPRAHDGDGGDAAENAPAPDLDAPLRVLMNDELRAAIRDCLARRVPAERHEEFQDWALHRRERGYTKQLAEARGVRPDTFGDAMDRFLVKMQECLGAKEWGPPPDGRSGVRI